MDPSKEKRLKKDEIDLSATHTVDLWRSNNYFIIVVIVPLPYILLLFFLLSWSHEKKTCFYASFSHHHNNFYLSYYKLDTLYYEFFFLSLSKKDSQLISCDTYYNNKTNALLHDLLILTHYSLNYTEKRQLFFMGFYFTSTHFNWSWGNIPVQLKVLKWSGQEANWPNFRETRSKSNIENFTVVVSGRLPLFWCHFFKWRSQ